MADIFEDEVEQTITIDEYLKGVEDEEMEADLVLGGDDGKECTYDKGYMKRQAIFSCLTCTPDGNAGVCTACSLLCHEGHEIVELWTKRNFRCDCGNSKFGVFCCKLAASKDPENLENSYNQNFKGSYCTCGRPYPDPEAEDQVEMVQCCICEDWFHENHLGLESTVEIPRDGEGESLYEDVICQGCAKTCSFLTLYSPSILTPVRQNDVLLTNGKEGIEVAETPSACVSSSKLENGTVSLDSPKLESVNAPAASATLHDDKGTTSVDSPKLEPIYTSAVSEISKHGKAVSLEENSKTSTGLKECSSNPHPSQKCIVGVDLRVAAPILEKPKSMLLFKNWRDLLCRCETCKEFYTQKGICFLIDREDTIAEYEKIATEKRQEKLQEEEGAELNFLNNLGHVEKIEILSGINDLKNELRSFLESADKSKTITSADVKQFVDNLARKRRRLE